MSILKFYDPYVPKYISIWNYPWNSAKWRSGKN